MVNLDEVMQDLNRYKIAYDTLVDKLKDREIEVRYWIDLFNAAREIMIQYSDRLGMGTDVDDLIIKRRDMNKQKETTWLK